VAIHHLFSPEKIGSLKNLRTKKKFFAKFHLSEGVPLFYRKTMTGSNPVAAIQSQRFITH
jgi:hypothetical protein